MKPEMALKDACSNFSLHYILLLDYLRDPVIFEALTT